MDKNISLSEDFPLPTPEQWKKEVEKSLKSGSSPADLVTGIYEGLDLQPVYGAGDWTRENHFPGFSPFDRGAWPAGYLHRPWHICQPIDADDPGTFNRILTDELKQGLNAIYLVVNDSTGSDPEPVTRRARGLTISSLSEFSAALAGIDLTTVPFFVDAGYTSLPLVMMLLAFERQRGLDLKLINGCIQADPLGVMALRGRLPVSLECAFDQMAWALKWSHSRYPGLKTIGVDATTYFEAGATATMELAFALATGVEYITRMMDRDVPPGDVSRAMRFGFGVGPFFFLELAKLRAARMLWSRVIREFGCPEEAGKMTIHARTAFHNQTRSDPHLNTVRTTTEALSAVLGGADSLETNAYDESFSNPDRFSRRLARNIQLILYHEAHLQQPIDPAGGAHFVEKLTRDIAREAWSIFQAIEKQGGMAESLKTGSIQKRISKIKARKMADVFCLKTGIVGSNIYCLQPEKPDDPGESDTGSPARGGFQEPVKEQEKSTDKTKCRSILSRLSQVPAQDEPEIVARGAEAFLCGCTLGEIVETLNIRGAPGDSVSPVEIERFSEPFEGLREKMDRHIRETGHRPEIFLLLLDSSSQARSGAELARRILEIAGFGILFSEEIPDHESLPEGVIPSTVRAVVVCSDDADSEGTLESIGRLKQRRPESVIALCGYPEKNRVKLQEMGVDIYLNPRGDAFRILKNLMARLGFIPE